MCSRTSSMKCTLTSSQVCLATVMVMNHCAPTVGPRLAGVHCCVTLFHVPASAWLGLGLGLELGLGLGLGLLRVRVRVT